MMQIKNPKVSVIMSVYNGHPFLNQAIESILKQNFTDFEFIIVDDCSSDSSLKIISNYRELDSRIRIITNEQNYGPMKSANIGIKEARGEYIARIDSDDISYPKRLSSQVDFLDKNLDFGLVGSWGDIINSDNTVLRQIKMIVESDDIKNKLIKYNPFFHSAIMFRKEIVDNIGLYDEGFRLAGDYEFYFRVIEKYKVANLPESLIAYRVHENSLTGKKRRKQLSYAIRAKWRAIRRGQYPIYFFFYLLKSCIAWVRVPRKFVRDNSSK